MFRWRYLEVLAGGLVGLVMALYLGVALVGEVDAGAVVAGVPLPVWRSPLFQGRLSCLTVVEYCYVKVK